MVSKSVRVGGKKVLATGSVLVPADESQVVIQLDDLEFLFEFTQDEKSPTKVRATSENDGKVLRVVVNSHQDVFRNGITKTFATVGDFNDEELSVSFMVQGMKNKSKQFSYTFVSSVGGAVGDQDDE